MEQNSSFVEISSFKRQHVAALYTTRDGGCSSGCYSSFNLGLHVEDEVSDVLKNRIKLENNIGRKIVFMNQTHSNRVCFVTEKDISDSENMLKEGSTSLGIGCDGIVTDSTNIALAVLTADCLPLLLSTADGKVVGAVHCGWRGIYSGIIENAVKLIRFKSRSPLEAYIGPCIGPNSFEVGAELYEKFSLIVSDVDRAFVRTGNEKYLCSLPELATQILVEHNVESITYSNVDTNAKDSNLYSYRRQNVTGRFASVIYRV
ncbi:MAG: peptidoglycan editing factor PgeF [Succinivibrio sp.]